ncbi:MAG: nucleotidyl transferase AbiEii/AbiGii toxin family protein [Candidatus Cloacimonetes bacterium]|nr:nucleotidyl transferase AbiEii/AbiGii toxin family protein [Candidatus Cloacimonadota bacterium]
MDFNPLSYLLTEPKARTLIEYRRLLREAIQKICLLGLWRGGFFEHAAFYGGTALRMMYKLDRFSEDMDFSLLKAQPDFRLGDYLGTVSRELAAWNIDAELQLPVKKESNIESAFIKANTLSTLLTLKIPDKELSRLHRDEISSVKFEIDPNPPCPFDTEFRFILDPIPFSVRTMSLADLFAGKMHAVLARSWQNRVKGRDWYDLVWFVRNKIPLNILHLTARLQQSKHMVESDCLDEQSFRAMLQRRIETIDFEQAKQDVLPFIPHPESIQNWSKDLFKSVIELIEIES